ncbi:DinB family protein [Hazenella sp. IB182357]|uniref:DinB family protein n=1 Tax=Polycladospora coralii TaxID=2771432 RepID=A0A926NA17_9BACL|nr:DinB family protein [Polycladospora coralii]MBD1372981.1 DinB family protein [Polycladospora coralii]
MTQHVQAGLIRSLTGEGAHVDSTDALLALSPELAGRPIEGNAFTIFQITDHMIYWQEYWAKWMEGEAPPLPKRAIDSFSTQVAPSDQTEWDNLVDTFHQGVKRAIAYANSKPLFEPIPQKPKYTYYEFLQWTATHNSYHLGQIVVLRRMLDAWPSPSGGETW